MRGLRLLRCFSPAIVVFLFALVTLAGGQAPTVPGKALPPGPMQAKVKAACTQCHNTGRITERHLTRRQWSAELDKMEGLGAVVSADDRSALLTYLTRNFGPEKGAGRSQALPTSRPRNNQ